MSFRTQKWIAAVSLACIVGGCASVPQSSKDAPLVAIAADNRVIIDSVVVQIDQGSLEISGQVHRKPGFSAALGGRIDVEFVGPDGDVIDGLPVLMVPHEMTASQPSVFRSSYGFIPPKGSFLRFHFVDSALEAQEDIEGGFFDAGINSGGGSTAGTHPAGWSATGNHATGHGQGAGHYNNGHTRGFGGNFGSHSFGPGGGGR